MGSPWKVVFAFVGVFIAGSVFGGFFALRVGGRVLQMENPAMRAKPPTPQNPQQQRPILSGWEPVQAARLMRVYADRLGLTPEQKAAIDPLIQRATEDIRRQQQANFRENTYILQRLQQDIAKELTAEQRKRLEKIEQRQKELGSQFGGRGNPGQRPTRDGSRGPGGPAGSGGASASGAPGGPPGPGGPRPATDEGDSKGMRPQPPAPEPGDAGK